MRRVLLFGLFAVMAMPVFADKPILLATPKGIWQCDIIDGIPQPWKPVEMDVIVRGFGNIPDTPTTPVPPVSDSIIQQVKGISQTALKDKSEATAVAAIIDTLTGMNLSEANFKQALTMSLSVADSSLGSNGGLVEWGKKVIAVTSDPAKIKAGVIEAWGVAPATIAAISKAAANPEQPATEEALDFAAIIAIIQAIIALLKQLGII